MATAQKKRTYLSPPTYYDPTQKGPLHSAHSTEPYYKPKPPKKDLKAHDSAKDDRTEIAKIAKGLDELARLYDKGKPVLQAPLYMRNKDTLRKKLSKDPKKVMSDLERYLHIDMKYVKGLPVAERKPYLISHLERYLTNKIPEVIAEQQRHPEIETPEGKDLYTMVKKAPKRTGEHGHPYRHGYHWQAAAAVIGITILLLIGTSFLTGQISGAVVISELENSPDFPYTLLIFLVVVFLFGMLWRSSKHYESL